MKRRGVAIGGGLKTKKWRSEAADDEVRSIASDESLGEKLPSEEENEDAAVDARERSPSPALQQQVPNPVVWMVFKVGDKLLRPLHLEVFADLHPEAAAAFVALCCGELQAPGGQKLSYAGSSFHRIFAGSLAQGGDLDVELDRPAPLEEESPSCRVALTHSRLGLLSVAKRGSDADGMQFSLTLSGGSAAHRLDARRVVLGQVLSTGEEEALHPLRYLDAAGSSSGVPLKEVFIDSCGISSEAECTSFAFKLLRRAGETEVERYARSGFTYPPLQNVVTAANSDEILKLVERDIDMFAVQVEAAEVEARPSMEAGTARQVFRQCEQLEVGLTKLLLLLDEVDFRTLGDVRALCKRAQSRIRQLSAKLGRAKAWSQEGETEAYEQRAGL